MSDKNKGTLEKEEEEEDQTKSSVQLEYWLKNLFCQGVSVKCSEGVNMVLIHFHVNNILNGWNLRLSATKTTFWSLGVQWWHENYQNLQWLKQKSKKEYTVQAIVSKKIYSSALKRFKRKNGICDEHENVSKTTKVWSKQNVSAKTE